MKSQIALKSVLILVAVALSTSSFAQELKPSGAYILEKGISVGTVIAMIISWDTNKSLVLALFHGLLGWVYVIYHYLNK